MARSSRTRATSVTSTSGIWYDFNFSSPPTVTVNQVVAIQIQTNAASGHVWGSNANAYGGGELY